MKTNYVAIMAFAFMFCVSGTSIADEVDVEKIVTVNRIQYEHYCSSWVKEYRMSPDFRFLRSSCNHELVNVVTFCDLDEEAVQVKMQELMDEADRENFNFSWWVTPFSSPDNLAQLLEDNGFSIFMSCDSRVNILNKPIEVVLPVGVTIEPVTTSEQMKDYVDILAACFAYDKSMSKTLLSDLIERDLPSNPEVEHYMAYFNGEPVCTGMILIVDEKTTTFSEFATLPKARGRGIGTAMMNFRLKRSQELGAETAVLIAAPMAQGINQKTGFKKSHDVCMYAYRPTT